MRTNENGIKVRTIGSEKDSSGIPKHYQVEIGEAIVVNLTVDLVMACGKASLKSDHESGPKNFGNLNKLMEALQSLMHFKQ